MEGGIKFKSNQTEEISTSGKREKRGGRGLKETRDKEKGTRREETRGQEKSGEKSERERRRVEGEMRVSVVERRCVGGRFSRHERE